MENLEDYRETPRTWTTPGGEQHAAPEKVDPAVLTDDRKNDELLVFEKSWGHRLLAGVGFAMLVGAIVIVLYFLLRLSSIIGVMDVVGGALAVQFTIWVMGAVFGALTIPPALVAIYVAKHPKYAFVAVAFAVIALLLVAGFFGYAKFLAAGTWIATTMWTMFLAAFPIVYLIAAIKVMSSSKE